MLRVAIADRSCSVSIMPARVAESNGPARPLRSDAARTVERILQAADQVLADHPSASMDTIASAAGVARTTVHRHFATRDTLLRALALWGVRRVEASLEEAAGTPETPAFVALYQATVNVCRVKVALAFTQSLAHHDPEVAEHHARVRDKVRHLLARVQAVGQLRPEVDLPWAQRVFRALVHEAVTGADPDETPDALAAHVIDTFFNGFGPGSPAAPSSHAIHAGSTATRPPHQEAAG